MGPRHLLSGATTTPIVAWVDGVPVEDAAAEQLRNVANLPFVRRLAVMPDVHWGMGATVGSVIGTRGAIVPAAVGVDIGCGMMAVRTGLRAADLPDSLSALRTAIEKAVPAGRTNDGGPGDRGSWSNPPEVVVGVMKSLLEPRLRGVLDMAGDNLGRQWGPERAVRHLGTLGTGNHFIEVCLDEEDHVWVMLHSGSRGIGNAIGRHFIALAQQDMKRWFIDLPDRDLAYIPEGSEHFERYLAAVEWAQDYARQNRWLMMQAALKALQSQVPKPFEAQEMAVECHHNYVVWENHGGENLIVTRKGAVRARAGDLGIIPGSMGARSYIVRGLGNPASLMSCSHGAGRAMSRAEAKRRFTVADHEAALAGIECDASAGTLDETPAAYKPIEAVMAAQSDLVEVVHELHQVLCVKGAEDSRSRRRKERRADAAAKTEA